MKVKKIVYVTGTRADFGLMAPVLKSIEQSPLLSLSIYATGMHLMPQFGFTLKEVIHQHRNVKKINSVFNSDGRNRMAGFVADFYPKLLAHLAKDRPDIVLLLGDRVEMLSAAMCCLYLGIPVAHVHGGEKTYTVDEIARHSITKLSSIHFVANQESALRVKRLGEEEWRVHVVGAPALDVILHEKLPTRVELFNKLGVDNSKKIILVTLHPISEKIEESSKQIKEVLSAVKDFLLPVVVIYPNADPGGKKMIKVLEKVKNTPNIILFPSLEHKYFLALEREAAVWIGNSSAGIIESAMFQTPVVNIGNRQKGRMQSNNILNSDYDRVQIKNAIERCLNDRTYRKRLAHVENKWGDGNASSRITEVLEKVEVNEKLIFKRITY